MVSLVRRYYLYRATLSPGFYIPVSVVYMETQGLGLADIGFVQGAFLFGMVACELPTGYLGDRLGRRAALALGSGVTVAVMLGFTVADSTAGFAAVYVLWSVGWTFRTGTADAWLYELLAARGAEDVGRATVLSGVSMALTLSSGTANVLGGRVAAVVGPLTFLSATGVAVALLGGLLWTVTHPVRDAAADAAPA